MSLITKQIPIYRAIARNYELRIMNYELWYLLTQMIKKIIISYQNSMLFVIKRKCLFQYQFLILNS